jgi:hypothetical protein
MPDKRLALAKLDAPRPVEAVEIPEMRDSHELPQGLLLESLHTITRCTALPAIASPQFCVIVPT